MTTAKKPKPVKALVIVQASWKYCFVLHAYLGPVQQSPSGELIAVPASEVSLDDGYFAEVTFYPTKYQGRWVKVLIPKHELATIVWGETEVETAGFKLSNLR